MTTHAVLTEIADALCAQSHRAWAAHAIGDLLGDHDITCVEIDSGLFAGSLDLYRARHDKAWSLTDCMSLRMHSRRTSTASKRATVR